MKIGVLTFHRAFNCGAMLQAWAMKTALERLGHSVEFPVCNHVGEIPRWVAHPNPSKHGLNWVVSWGNAFVKNALSVPVEDVARFRYGRFRVRHLPERICEPGDFGLLYDALVVGSDQVWNDFHAGRWMPLFLGENWGPEVRGVAYGASCGDLPPTAGHLERLRRGMERFAAVSVRERFMKDELERVGGGTECVEVVADPTLLPEREDYEMLAANVKPPRGRYLFMYNVMLPSGLAVKMARAVASRLGVRAVVSSVYQYTRWGAPCGLTWGLSPERLVAYTAAADYVLAVSFHGTVMGLMFGKPTLSLLEKPDGGRSRSGELLRLAGLGDRMVSLQTPVDEMCRILQRGGLPGGMDGALAHFRASSREWLALHLDMLRKGGRHDGEGSHLKGIGKNDGDQG